MHNRLFAADDIRRTIIKTKSSKIYWKNVVDINVSLTNKIKIFQTLFPDTMTDLVSNELLLCITNGVGDAIADRFINSLYSGKGYNERSSEKIFYKFFYEHPNRITDAMQYNTEKFIKWIASDSVDILTKIMIFNFLLLNTSIDNDEKILMLKFILDGLSTDDLISLSWCIHYNMNEALDYIFIKLFYLQEKNSKHNNIIFSVLFYEYPKCIVKILQEHPEAFIKWAMSNECCTKKRYIDLYVRKKIFKILFSDRTIDGNRKISMLDELNINDVELLRCVTYGINMASDDMLIYWFYNGKGHKSKIFCEFFLQYPERIVKIMQYNTEKFIKWIASDSVNIFTKITIFNFLLLNTSINNDEKISMLKFILDGLSIDDLALLSCYTCHNMNKVSNYILINLFYSQKNNKYNSIIFSSTIFSDFFYKYPNRIIEIMQENPEAFIEWAVSDKCTVLSRVCIFYIFFSHATIDKMLKISILNKLNKNDSWLSLFIINDIDDVDVDVLNNLFICMNNASDDLLASWLYSNEYNMNSIVFGEFFYQYPERIVNIMQLDPEKFTKRVINIEYDNLLVRENASNCFYLDTTMPNQQKLLIAVNTGIVEYNTNNTHNVYDIQIECQKNITQNTIQTNKNCEFVKSQCECSQQNYRCDFRGLTYNKL